MAILKDWIEKGHYEHTYDYFERVSFMPTNPFIVNIRLLDLEQEAFLDQYGPRKLGEIYPMESRLREFTNINQH